MAFVLDIASSRRVSAALGRIERFRASLADDGVLSEELRARLVDAGRIRSAGALCRLSGLRLDDADIAAVVRGEHDGAPVAEILSCHAALDRRLTNGVRLLEVGDLLRLNAVLGGANPTEPEPAPLRDTDLLREAFDDEGHATGRVFPGLAPRMLADTVDELLTWLEYELRDRRRNEVLVIAGFALGLLAASPFATRNGRTVLALMDLLLRRAGHEWLACGSLVAEIESRRAAYHEAFDRSRIRMWVGEADPAPWIEFVIDAVDRERERVASRIELDRGAQAFPPLQRAILDEVKRHGTVDAGLLIQATGANRNTLKDNLRRLVERGVLERTGQRRGARYRMRPID